MKTIIIKETDSGTEVVIDGARIDRLYRISVKKEPDQPIEIELSGAVTSAVKFENELLKK